MSYNSTKAETLSHISKILSKNKIKNIVIPKFIFFTKSEYKKNKKKTFFKIKEKFKKKLIIIRSSSKDEDNLNQTNAGKYISFQKVSIDEKEIIRCIDKIIAQFKSSRDQILIQEFIDKPEISGVIFTREANYNSPYFVINYDKSGKTNLVTSGQNNPTMKCELVYRDKIFYSKKFFSFLKNINYLEKLFSSDRLDIEFALKNKKWHLFQCRNLPRSPHKSDDEEIKKTLVNLKKKIDKLKSPNPTLNGKTTLFSNMSDWNPAEMIGNKPKPLAISLYSELITNKTWGVQRKNYGYKDVSPNILMVNLAGTPFIDLRTDINSFLPSGLDDKLNNKIVKNYLNKIKLKPYLHDKIEFDILLTCYEFDKDKINFLSKSEKSKYINRLKKLTNEIFSNKKNFLIEEQNKIKLLDSKIKKIQKTKLSEIQKIFFLIDDCKKYGTLPFSGIARMAFICTQILKNLQKKNIINSIDIEKLYSSIPTITKQINYDHSKIKTNKKNKNFFLKKYGHLRPSTYSISSLNYKEGFNNYFSNKSPNTIKLNKKFDLTNDQYKKITKLFNNNKLNITSRNFIKLLKETIKYREYSKFIFSKSIDEIFNCIIKLGKIIDIKRNDLEFISIDKIINSYGVLETRKLSQILKNEIRENKKSFNITKKINFPDFITNSKDIYFQKIKSSKGNFITNKKISGNIKYLDKLNNYNNLNHKIVLLDNADPGFDFIFSHNIKGLITKYGGANSHMAIRCLELSVPAIIGIGSSEFDNLKKCNLIEVDCEQKTSKKIN